MRIIFQPTRGAQHRPGCRPGGREFLSSSEVFGSVGWIDEHSAVPGGTSPEANSGMPSRRFQKRTMGIFPFAPFAELPTARVSNKTKSITTSSQSDVFRAIHASRSRSWVNSHQRRQLPTYLARLGGSLTAPKSSDLLKKYDPSWRGNSYMARTGVDPPPDRVLQGVSVGDWATSSVALRGSCFVPRPLGKSMGRYTREVLGPFRQTGSPRGIPVSPAFQLELVVRQRAHTASMKYVLPNRDAESIYGTWGR